MIDHVAVRPRTYHDSVRLMQANAAAGAVPGVDKALVAMATELNLQLAADIGFALGEPTTPDDMLIAIRATDETAIASALAALDGALERPAADGGGSLMAPRPRLTSTAAARVGADLALVSVPGPYAYVEAVDALHFGLHVMVFSDNVPIAQEIDLKRQGAERGLLVMGPDCGTAIVAGVGLGFANVVAPGPVGIVGASGTGIQQLCCLLDEAEVGIRHALGTGSRDLSAAVGGASTLAALAALDRDPGTEAIVIVSKPPDPTVAAGVEQAAARCETPAVTCFIGEDTLESGAGRVMELLGKPAPRSRSWVSDRKARAGGILGLFSGGTLRDDAKRVLSVELGEPAADFPMLDLGGDDYTRGRAHPMIDQRLRIEHLVRGAADPTVGVILMDLVLGHGAHSDPASELAPIVAAAGADGVAVVVSLCGTGGDPQRRDRQAAILHDAGASVYLANAAAARAAAGLVEG